MRKLFASVLVVGGAMVGISAYWAAKLVSVMRTLDDLFRDMPQLDGIPGELILGEFARFLVIQSAKSEYCVLDNGGLEKAIELRGLLLSRTSAEWWMQLLPDLLECSSASEHIDVFNRWCLTTLHRDLANSWAAKKVAQAVSVN